MRCSRKRRRRRIWCWRRRCSPSGRPRISPRRWRGFIARGCRRPKTFSIPARAPAGPVTIAAGKGKAVRRAATIAGRAAIEEREIIAAPRRMAEGSVWFRAAIGRKKNAEARWLLPMICRRGGIDKHDIGAIRIMDTTTEFEISERAAESFAAKIRRPDKEDNIRIEAMSEAPPREEVRKQEWLTEAARQKG